MVTKAYNGGAKVPGVATGAFSTPQNPYQGPPSPYVQRLGPAGTTPAPPQPAVKPKVFTIPQPDSGGVSSNKTVMLNEIDWPLFEPKSGLPRLEDVHQYNIANCALASIITAMAYTPKGRGRITKMIKESNAPTLTKHVGKHFSYFKGPREVAGKRYFTVTFPGKSAVSVSSVFYTDEQTSPDMIYMKSRTPKVLWPCVLEKAYAAMIGGYHKFSDDPVVVWKDVLGSPPKFVNLQSNASPRVPDRDAIRQARRARVDPTIAAGHNVYHGVVVKKSSGNDGIIVYDQYDDNPKDAKKLITTLRKEETALFYAQL